MKNCRRIKHLKPMLMTVTVLLNMASCGQPTKDNRAKTQLMHTGKKDSAYFRSGYVAVNGLNMYYEEYGTGKPLILIHGGGSTIQTSFGRIIPALARKRKVIAIELQGHGRTNDRDADLSFEQDADDVAVLLKKLNITRADFFGFSNGGTTTLQVAIRHPELCRSIILGSALAKREGAPPGFWDFMKQAKLENMPLQLKEAFLALRPDSNALQVMHDRDAKRMLHFEDITDEKIASIKIPALIIIGDKDVITPQHASEMHRLMSTSTLEIVPGGHGAYMGEVTTLQPGYKETDFVIPMIETFLDAEARPQ